jgi:putative redox protein
MECKVKWIEGGMSFLAETGSNHAVLMDGAPEAGGRNLAPRPMELLLAGTGGCTAFDVVAILKKGRHAVTGCEVSLTAERAETDPKVFTHIHFHFRITGKGTEAGSRHARDQSVEGEVLLGIDHARRDGEDYARLRDRRSRVGAKGC